jgi:hypothetical protein
LADVSGFHEWQTQQQGTAFAQCQDPVVKYTVRAFRNKQNFIHAIYFHCGGLDLAPSATE